MSTESTYVYIPNLVGRQMLRIPVVALDDEAEVEQVQVPDTPSALILDTNAVKSASKCIRRDDSPSVGEQSEHDCTIVNKKGCQTEDEVRKDESSRDETIHHPTSK
ncbi:hypothetical protein DM02DRAFT_658397 [Periconia macrospinosa]|uniref:Uncharacterized protein n=1 Tax=Periconia macrospinosa TaxID=97972 RepID=A0A2V1DGQ7_9PLEO|nr:hypothetical protein DM02DRAFT_658397 [Periconia macrospinosa]